MSPQEFWLIVDQRRPPEMIGAMRADTFEELRSMLHEDATNAKSR